MNKTIWIVEDERSILEVMQILLPENGYQVRVFSNPSMVLETLYAEIHKPDLICLDVHMNGGDGRDIARQIKQNDESKEIPILLMTADVHIEEKAQQAGADDYIKKPFSMETFISKIQHFV